MARKQKIEPELSRPLAVEKIPAGGMEEDIIANRVEREALAKRFGLLELSRLEAHLDIDHAEKGMFKVTGLMIADVVQECVVSLEPVETHIEDKINVIYAAENLLDTGANAVHIENFEDEVPEPIINGFMDLGELLAQHLAVAINPYPRKEGVRLPKGIEYESGKSGCDSPFQSLLYKKKTE